MKKSEMLTIAMNAVLESGNGNDIKLLALDDLMERRRTELFYENKEEEANA